MTEHEDLELGRCIQEKLGISCIRAYEANRLFKQNYDYNKQSAKERLVEFLLCIDSGDYKSDLNQTLQHSAPVRLSKVTNVEIDLRQKMFNEIAASSVATYHPNKQPIYQYELYRALKADEIDKLIKHTHQFEKDLTYDDRNCDQSFVFVCGDSQFKQKESCSA